MKLLIAVTVTVCILASTACAKTAQPAAPTKPECASTELASIEAAYVSEALSTCRGKKFNTCAELPAIEEKYRTKREEWIACH